VSDTKAGSGKVGISIRLGDDYDLDNIALDLRRYLNKDKNLPPAGYRSPPEASSDGGITGQARRKMVNDQLQNIIEAEGSPLYHHADRHHRPSEAVLEAASHSLQKYNIDDPDTSTVELECDASARLAHPLERANSSDVNTTEYPLLEPPVVPYWDRL